MPTTIFSTPFEFAIACLVMIVAQLVYVLFGFGSGLIAVGCLALVFPDIKDVVVLLLLVNLPSELWVVLSSRKEIRWRPIAGLGSGILVGIPCGAFILSVGKPDIMLTILGVFLVIAGIVFLRLPAGGKYSPPALAAPPTGLVSGLLTGLFGTGGPPLIIWYHLSASNKAIFRSNLMTLFLLQTFIRIPSYFINDLLTAPRLWSALALVPAAMFGGWLGHRFHVVISEETFRKMVSGLLSILGLVLLIKLIA